MTLFLNTAIKTVLTKEGLINIPLTYFQTRHVQSSILKSNYCELTPFQIHL